MPLGKCCPDARYVVFELIESAGSRWVTKAGAGKVS